MQLRTILAQPPAEGERDHQVRRLFYAINVTDAEKESFEQRFGITLINGYGLSEGMTLLTCAPVVGPRRWPSIGLPSPGRRILLLDDQGNEVAPGEVGEIVAVGRPGRDIMLGYYKDPEATEAALRPGGRMHTGDNAYADEQGYLYFFDRKKDMIKRAGENVSALEVESVVLDHPLVVEAAVIGVPDDIRDEAVAVVVVDQRARRADGRSADRVLRRAPGEVQGPDDRPLRRRAAQDLDRQGPQGRAAQDVQRLSRPFSAISAKISATASALSSPAGSNHV